MSKENILYRVLHRYFPIVDAFSKRELPKQIAINMGHRIMRLRELYEAAEERRQILVEKHAERDEKGAIVLEGQSAVMVDTMAFDKEWKELLDSVIEGFPKFPKQLNPEDLPDDVTSVEVEALLRLQLLQAPEVWD